MPRLRQLRSLAEDKNSCLLAISFSASRGFWKATNPMPEVSSLRDSNTKFPRSQEHSDERTRGLRHFVGDGHLMRGTLQ